MLHYREQARTSMHAQDMLHGLAEGFVRANMATIHRDRESFPCCVGCGGFVLRHVHATPLTQVFGNLSVQGAESLAESKLGSAFDLACYQCAQRRLDGDTGAYVVVGQNEDGCLRCVVVWSNADDEDMGKYAPGDLCEDGVCGCGEPE